MSKGIRSVIGRAALAFAILFSAAGAGQYWFLRQQLRGKDTADLADAAQVMHNDIAFADRWNLEGYRRTTEGPDIYLVLTADGTLVDVHGFLPGMLSRVSLPFPREAEREIHFMSEMGERWILYEHHLSDGLVILGVRAEVAPGNLQERFLTNAARFGNTIAAALKTPERAIDESFDYAILDNDRRVRWAIGGIPLKSNPPEIPSKTTLAPVLELGRNLYGVLRDPVLSKSGQKVGLVTVYQVVTDEQRVLGQSAKFNVIVASTLWLLTLALAAVFLSRTRPREISCAQIPSLDESESVEFKSSLRWSHKENRPSREVEHAIVKAVAGFLNSENGGTLIIGVTDDKQILGLDADYATFGHTKRDRDGYEQVLRQTLINELGEQCCARWVTIRFCTLQSKEICIVSVAAASEPVFLEENGRQRLYVRSGNSTRPFDVREAVAYSRDRWGIGRMRPLATLSAAVSAGAPKG